MLQIRSLPRAGEGGGGGRGGQPTWESEQASVVAERSCGLPGARRLGHQTFLWFDWKIVANMIIN